jgi:methionyl-tRNA formyltransferase
MKLRIHFVTENDDLYVIKFFETFFDEYPRSEIEIVGITIEAAFNESKLSTARRVWSLYGPGDFARLLARVVAQRARRRSIAALARDLGIPVVPTRSVNDPDFVRRMRQVRPDLIVSVAAPEIFREEILESPRIGCINVHSGRLPAYRGMMPTFWQMLSGEPTVTVTVHEMNRDLDAGAILGTVECPIERDDSLDRVITSTKREGARLMIRVLREIARGSVNPRPLDMSDAKYYSFPKHEDARELRRRGYRMV